ncbi:SDR family NAD(P)-dependent oxidoreductase [Clostridium sp. AM58-1XD]|nr:SDR family NAD(P)-dependent oxidoreductase [Clostridium sp. AM58-1XD]RGY99479.1 SDR family NAD(P)-dependent oxidoreductase [Clostridium sp. AM58-1XD]
MKKIAVITGASSGMGREMIFQLADRFRTVEEIWVIARRKERLDELNGQVPAVLRTFPIDITDKQALTILKQALAEEKPDVKFLVNAAGYGKIGLVGEVPLEEETGMAALNCEALVAVTHVVLPYMSEHSRIIQFASAAAFLPQPKFAVYAATKAFVLSYSRALNEELRDRKICVTAVCPGPVKTEFFDIAETNGKIPLYKKLAMADPKKVARKALMDSCVGKSISIYGILMKLFFLLCKVVPHRMLLKIMGMM